MSTNDLERAHTETPSLSPESEQERERPVYVVDSVYKAWLEGNRLFPQTAFGIVASVMNAIAHDEHFNFNEFEKSKLSEEQVADVGRQMSRLHAAHDIPVTTDAYKGLFEKGGREADENTQSRKSVSIVSAERLQGIWEAVRGIVHQVIDDYIAARAAQDSALLDVYVAPRNEAARHFMDIFWREPAFQPYVRELKKIFGAIYHAVSSSEVRELATSYRNELNRRKVEKPQRTAYVWATYSPQFLQLVERKLGEELNKEEMLYASKILKRILDQ